MTSGTTGTPKLVLYDGAAITAQLLQSESIVRKCPEVKHDRLARELRMLAFLPFYHIFGLMASLLWFIFFGVTFVFLERYDSRSIQYACKGGRVTHFFAVPAVWEQTARQLLREAERQGQKEKLLRAVRFSNGLQSVFPRLGARLARRVLFRRVREQALGTEPMFCISGGGFLQPQAAELMNGLGYGMHNGYGMTETGILSVELSRRAKRRLDGGVGQPLQALSGGWRIAEDGVLELRSPLLYTAMLENGVRVPRRTSGPSSCPVKRTPPCCTMRRGAATKPYSRRSMRSMPPRWQTAQADGEMVRANCVCSGARCARPPRERKM